MAQRSGWNGRSSCLRAGTDLRILFPVVKFMQNDARTRIIQAADELFFTYGYGRVTVDEIAKQLGMSKKTLYKHFRGKEALLTAVIDQFAQEINVGVDDILTNDALTFVEKLSRMMAFVGERMPKIESRHMMAIRLEAPAVWTRILALRRQTIEHKFGLLLQEGVQAGMIRADVNLELVRFMILSNLQALLVPERLSMLPLTAVQLLESTIHILFVGILTNEGRDAINAPVNH